MTQVSKSAAPWISLAGTLVLFLVYLAWLRPTQWFGRYRDDAAYFSSAKGLADGRGYVIPSLPENPPQTKYPVLYPWLLSWIWKWNPSFPSNLEAGVRLTTFFGCWFLVVAFQLLRKLDGVGDWPALVIVFLCALDPYFLFFSGSLMSDVPFMALALASALAADSAMRAGRRLPPAALVGAMAGLSVMMRSVGLAVVAGILAAAIFRRAFRQALAFCLGAAAFASPAVWGVRRLLTDDSGVSTSGVSSTLIGWQQTLFFYTSYLKTWRLFVPTLQVFWAMLRANLEAIVLAPATYWLSPTFNIGQGLAANSLGALVGAFTLAGILRQARRQEWKPLHFIFVPYLVVIVLWNYPIMERFLLLYLPLFLVGLWIEGKHLTGLVLTKLRSPDALGERLLAAGMAGGLVTLAGIAAWNYAAGHRPELTAFSRQQSQITLEKLQVYEWVRQHVPPGTVMVADDDVTLYLYTGRKGVMPIAFSTEYIYTHDQRVLDRDLAHISDAACAVGARYWLTSADDFRMDLPKVEAKERVARLMTGLPEVSRSQAGRVRLYDISSLFQLPRALTLPGRPKGREAPCPPPPAKPAGP